MGYRGGRRHQQRKPQPNQTEGSRKQTETDANTQKAVAATESEPQQPDTNAVAKQCCRQERDPNQSSIEKEMVKWTEVVGRWTRIVGFATIGVAFVGFIGIVATVWVGNKSDETARAAQRPWLRYDGLEPIGPLTYENNIAKIKVRFHLRNTGNSPALDVMTHAELRVVSDPPAIKSEPQAYCGKFKDEPTPDGPAGYISFPGEEPIKEEAELSIDLSKVDFSRMKLNLAAPPPTIVYVVVTCETYRFSFGEREPHQTGILFNLRTNIPSTVKFTDDEAVLGEMGIDPKLGNIPPANLRLAVLASFGN